MSISEEMMSQIKAQAESEYPHECCGMIFGPKEDKGALTRLRKCENVYDRYHEADPENFPRTAKTAYFIDPRELLDIQKETFAQKEDIRIIYHSHIDTGAYFSEEDQRVAAPEGQPAYPGVQYLVVSVENKQMKDQNLFSWNEERKEFTL